MQSNCKSRFFFHLYGSTENYDATTTVRGSLPTTQLYFSMALFISRKEQKIGCGMTEDCSPWATCDLTNVVTQWDKISPKPELNARFLTYTLLTHHSIQSKRCYLDFSGRKLSRDEHIQHKILKSDKYATELGVPRHITHDLPNSVEYQTNATGASVQGTPFESWIYACSPLVPSYCFSSRSSPGNWNGRQSLVPFRPVSSSWLLFMIKLNKNREMGHHCRTPAVVSTETC